MSGRSYNNLQFRFPSKRSPSGLPKLTIPSTACAAIVGSCVAETTCVSRHAEGSRPSYAFSFPVALPTCPISHTSHIPVCACVYLNAFKCWLIFIPVLFYYVSYYASIRLPPPSSLSPARKERGLRLGQLGLKGSPFSVFLLLLFQPVWG